MALQQEKIFLVVPAGTSELDLIKTSISKAKGQIVKDMQDATLVVFHKNGPHQILFRVRNLGLPVVRDDYIIDCAKVGVALPKEDYIVGVNEVSLAKKLSTLTAAAASAPKPPATTNAKPATASKPYLDSDDDEDNAVKVVPKPSAAPASVVAAAAAASSKKPSKAAKQIEKPEPSPVEEVLELAPSPGGGGAKKTVAGKGSNSGKGAKEVVAAAKNPVEAAILAASAPVVSKKPSSKAKVPIEASTDPAVTATSVNSGVSPLTPLLPAKTGAGEWELAADSPAGTPGITKGQGTGKVGDVTPVLQSPAKAPQHADPSTTTSDGAPVRSVDEIIAEGRASLLSHGGTRGSDPFLDRSDSDNDDEPQGSSARIAARRDAFANQRAVTLAQRKQPTASTSATVDDEGKGPKRATKRGRVDDNEGPSSATAKEKERASDETQSAAFDSRKGKVAGQKIASETVTEAAKSRKTSTRPESLGTKTQKGKASKVDSKDETDSDSASSSGSSIPDDPLIALSGGHDGREFLKSILETLHAPYTERVFGRCKKPTYLVVEGDELTPKVLYALAAGIPVLSVNWVYETLERRNESGGDGKTGTGGRGGGRQVGAKWAPGVTQQWPMIKIKSHHYHPYYCRALQEDAAEAQKRQKQAAPSTVKPEGNGKSKKSSFTEGHRADDLVRSKRPLILHGMVFCLLGQSKEPSTSVFAELLTLLGADVVRTPSIALGNLTAIIVMFDPEEATFPQRRQSLTRSEERSILYQQELLRQSEKHRGSGVPLITRQWIIDTVHAHRSLPFAGYHYPKLNLGDNEQAAPAPASTIPSNGKANGGKGKGAPQVPQPPHATHSGKGSTPKLIPKQIVGSREADDEVDVDALDGASSQKKGKHGAGSGDSESIPFGERSPLSDSTGLIPKKEPGPRSCAKSARHQWNTQTLCCSSDDDADAGGGGRNTTGAMRASLKTKRRLEVESESESEDEAVVARDPPSNLAKGTPKVKGEPPVAASSSSSASKPKPNEKRRNSDFLI